MNKRIDYIDVLKAIAIIAVVLYHVGYMDFGYLGVDIFLVINGYLLAMGFNQLKTFTGGSKFLINRLLRLYPVLIIASVACLAWGAYWMLPYNYYDLSQYTIATNLFINNILMSIKSSNYWNILNEYKPLMHTWYLGVIVQFYVFFAFLIILMKKVIKSSRNITIRIVEVCFILSFILYLIPSFSTTAKFYYLPFRIFEFEVGMWLALFVKDKSFKVFEKKWLMTIMSVVGCVGLLILLFFNNIFVSSTGKLLLTVFLTGSVLFTLPYANEKSQAVFSNKVLVAIGKCSFSIYVWHQIVFAFYRYSIASDINGIVFIILIAIISLLSVLSYLFIEQKVPQLLRTAKNEKRVIFSTIITLTAVLSVSFYLHQHSGVIRDVPELDIYKENSSSERHIAYNESAHRFDKDFGSTKKLHWLVVGDSYGRDFINVLAESDLSDKVELSYIPKQDLFKKNREKRLMKADLIFRTMSIAPDDSGILDFIQVIDSLGINTQNLVIVGSKLFGYSCGQVYRHRHDEDYYSFSLEIDESYFSKNEIYKNRWGSHYIDMVTPVAIGNNRVRVFSDDHKIISQDCEHFTQAGAKYYSRLLKHIIDKYLLDWENKS